MAGYRPWARSSDFADAGSILSSWRCWLSLWAPSLSHREDVEGHVPVVTAIEVAISRRGRLEGRGGDEPSGIKTRTLMLFEIA